MHKKKSFRQVLFPGYLSLNFVEKQEHLPRHCVFKSLQTTCGLYLNVFVCFVKLFFQVFS